MEVGMRVYDLVCASHGVTDYAFGFLEKTFGLSLSKTLHIKSTKVRSRITGEVIMLRYVYSPDPDCTDDSEKYEKYIDEHYDRLDCTKD